MLTRVFFMCDAVFSGGLFYNLRLLKKLLGVGGMSKKYHLGMFSILK